MKKFSWFLLLIILYSLCLPLQVFSHATLVESFPRQDEVLEEAPNEIRLKFSGSIHSEHSQLSVRNEKRETVDGKVIVLDNVQLILEVPNLSAGNYEVLWSAYSTDTHLTNGSYFFSILPVIEVDMEVVETTIETIEKDESQEVQEEKIVDTLINQEVLTSEIHIDNPNTLFSVFRAIEMITLISFVGLYFFVHWILTPNISPLLRYPFTKQAEIYLYLCATVILLVAAILRLIIYSQYVSSSISALAFTTLAGTLSLLRPILVVLFIILIIANANKWVQSIVISLIVLTFSLTSHALSYNLIISHFLHLLAVAIWCGGLVGLCIYSFGRNLSYMKLEFTHKCLTRFSLIALIMFLIVVISGAVMSLSYMGNTELLSNTYGKLFIFKMILTGIIILFACFHRYYWLPILKKVENQTDKSLLLRRLNNLIRIELLVLLIVVVIAGTLSSIELPENIKDNYLENKHEHHHNHD